MIENSNLKLEQAEILNSGDGLNWYIYANNNPLRFVDPTGLYINKITEFQKQNVGVNKSGVIGSVPSGRFWPSGEYKMNNLNNEGCLFVAAVNVANSIRNENMAIAGLPGWETNSGIMAASLSTNNDYFHFFSTNPNLADNYLERDFGTYLEQIQTLIKDVTGQDYDVNRIRGDQPFADLLKEIAEAQEYGAYIIADVGGHFINVTGYSEDSEGIVHLDYFNPSKNEPIQPYTIDSVKGFYRFQEPAESHEIDQAAIAAAEEAGELPSWY